MSEPRKSVLITGCSSGIGHSLARQFHSKGLRVFATARSTDSITDLAALGIETLPLELTSPESIKSLAAEVSARTGGKLDFLCNNAGRNYTVPGLDVEFDEVQQTFEVNLFAPMRLIQVLSPLLINAKGTIVQIGSIAGIMPYVFGSTYNASKAALRSYSDTLRVELAAFDVKVVEVLTGGVQSNIARTDRQLPPNSYYLPLAEEYRRRLRHSQEKGSTPSDEYARAVVAKVLNSSPPRYIWEGSMSWWVWFISNYLPRFVMDWAFFRMFNLWKLRGTASKKNK